jgi:tRNA A-37 threonylcarbamoyl transferase component Bud32
MEKKPSLSQTHAVDEDDLDSFDRFWTVKSDWFEPPNIRRGGWSGVIKYALNSASGKINVFIKRQENHITKTWNHLISGIPTFQKEYFNILRLARNDIPTLEPVYFGVHEKRAILITKALEGYQGLDNVDPVALSRKDKKALIEKVAVIIRQMHHCHFQHNCLYPKHIFVRQTAADWDIRIIDLEKMKRTLLQHHAIVRDLSTLFRHAGNAWSLTNKLRFFRAYRGETRLSPSSKKLWLQIARKSRNKRQQSGTLAG